MLKKNTIKTIIDTWLEDIQKREVIYRDEISSLTRLLHTKQITAISGVRRSGKTFLMFQLIQALLKENPNNVLYINFEDERFSNDAEQLDLIYKTFLEHRAPKGKMYFFFDEIQNVNHWEKWLARMYEKGIKFFVSGSNASLLQTEFSKSLTGRHKLIAIYPLSFRQFLSYKDPDLLKDSMAVERVARVKHHLENYIQSGGFPEAVYRGQTDLLKDYFNDIITKDIILRRNIRFKQSLKEIALLLMSNIARHQSLYSLNKILQARSINTIKNYVSFLEDAFLMLRVPFFSYSVRQQMANPFKIYAMDTGMRNSIAFQVTKDVGHLYENIVAVELVRRYSIDNIFYWKDKQQKEVDFLIRQGTQTNSLIQVCHSLENSDTKAREVKALLSASKEFKCENLFILTEDLWEEEMIKGKAIRYIPLWKWLLEQKE